MLVFCRHASFYIRILSSQPPGPLILFWSWARENDPEWANLVLFHKQNVCPENGSVSIDLSNYALLSMVVHLKPRSRQKSPLRYSGVGVGCGFSILKVDSWSFLQNAFIFGIEEVVRHTIGMVTTFKLAEGWCEYGCHVQSLERGSLNLMRSSLGTLGSGWIQKRRPQRFE